MPLDIGDALRTGFERTVARSGLMIAGALFVLGVLNGLFTNSLVRATMPSPDAMGGPGGPLGPGAGMGQAPTMGPAIPVSPIVAGILALLIGIVSVVVTITAIRTFVSAETERVPEEFYTRNMVWAWINVVVGGIVFAIVVGIGFVLLVIPGIFLLVSLFLWNVFVVVEDQNFVEGMRNSWALTGGHRLRLFLLGVIVLVVVAVVNGIFGVAAFFGGIAGLVVSQIGSALTSAFSLATIAATYNQLTALEAAEATGTEADV